MASTRNELRMMDSLEEPCRELPSAHINRVSNFCLCLDLVPPTHFSGDAFLLEGWCFEENWPDPPELSLRIEIAEPTSQERNKKESEGFSNFYFEIHPQRLSREDVGIKFPSETAASRSGFSFQMPIYFVATFRLSLFATRSDGEEVLLDSREFFGVPAQLPYSNVPWPPIARNDFEFFLDLPRERRSVTKQIAFHGWCVRKDYQAVNAMRARLGDLVFPLSFGLERRDVFSHFGGRPHSHHCGFEGIVKTPSFPADITFEAEFRGGWQELETVRIEKENLVQSALLYLGEIRNGNKPIGGKPRKGMISRLLENHVSPFYGDFLQHPPRPILTEKLPLPSALPREHLPKVTIVTPSYNQGEFLDETMQSVLSQEGVRLDYIVMDGGSKDQSPRIIEQYSSQLRFWQSKKDKGQSDAISQGFQHADSSPEDIYGYLNSDDILLPGTLRFVAEYFHSHPNVDFVFGHRVIINRESQQTGMWFTPFQSREDFRLVDLLPQETAFWRKRIYDEVGGVNPEFRFAMDWDLFLRFQDRGAVQKRLPYFLGGFRVHEDSKTVSLSHTLGKMECESIRKRYFPDVDFPEVDFQQKLQDRFRLLHVQGKLLSALWQFGLRV